MLFLLLLVADDLAPLKAKPVTALEALARTCGVSAGPVKWASVANGKMDRWAFACGRGETTDLTVFSLLPSGQQGVLCEVKSLRGQPKSLKLEPSALLALETLDRTPEQERTMERVLRPSWGHCLEIALSDVTHPTDGPTLLEPAAGIRFSADGFDVWKSVSRLFFGEVRRHVATGLRGMHFTAEGKEDGAIVQATVEPVPVAWPAKLAVHETHRLEWGDEVLIRGVKLRVRQAHDSGVALSLDAEGVHVEWRADKPQWVSHDSVFGAGLLPQAAGDTTREAVVFFEPPLPMKKLTLRGGDSGLEILSGQVFTDAVDVERFEPAED